jgi:AhpD family alkylhydroperoxidase
MQASENGFYSKWSASMARMKGRTPDIARAFGGFFQGLMKEGSLSVREKELIALGIGLSLRCEGCIYSHVEKCLKSGATPEQILEAAGVAVMMQGGPTYTYVPKVIEALDQFAAAAPAVPARPAVA